MGIVWGKPENYRKTGSSSAVRRNVNKESPRKKSSTRRNNNRPNREEEEEEEAEDMPPEIIEAMKEAGFDPKDPKEFDAFIESIQSGGKRRVKHKRK
jgi:hypothetical protein